MIKNEIIKINDNNITIYFGRSCEGKSTIKNKEA